MPYYDKSVVLIEDALTIYTIENNKKGWWYCYVKIRGAKRVRRSLRTTSRREAERLAKQLYYKLYAYHEEGLPIHDTTWDKLSKMYIDSTMFGDSTGHRVKMLGIYFSRFNNIKEITAGSISRWTRWRKGFWTSKEGDKYRRDNNIVGGRHLYSDISERTLRMEATVLKSMLHFAKDRGLIQHIPDIAPLRKMRQYKSDGTHKRAAFTSSHHARILRYLNWQYGLFIKKQQERSTGYYHAKAAGRVYFEFPILKNRRMWLWCHLLKASGLRPQEARRLRWRHISSRYDAEHDRNILEITVTREISKTGNPRMVYVIDHGTVVKGEGNLETALGTWRSLTPFGEDDDLVFCNVNTMGDRKALTQMTLYFCRMIKKHFGKKGSQAENFPPLITDDEGREYSSYSYRHMWATEKLRQGVSPYFVAEYLGTSEAQLRRHYSHVLAWDLQSEFYAKQEAHIEQRARLRKRAVVELSQATNDR